MKKSGFPNQAAGFAYDMPMTRLFAVSYRCTATKKHERSYSPIRKIFNDKKKSDSLNCSVLNIIFAFF